MLSARILRVGEVSHVFSIYVGTILTVSAPMPAHNPTPGHKACISLSIFLTQENLSTLEKISNEKHLEAGGGSWALPVLGPGCIFDFCQSDEAICGWRGC
jgi:hypothetical protein